jgi:hypothetical protein
LHKKKKTVTKVQRWEEKLFSALVDEKVSGVDERFMETKMAFYYQNMDTEDLVMAGSISDIENGYLLLSDLGLRVLLSLYCAKGKDFDQFIFKNEMKELGFNKFFAHKVFTQLEVWRSAMPDDISEDEMKGLWNTSRRLPDSVVYLQQKR